MNIRDIYMYVCIVFSMVRSRAHLQITLATGRQHIFCGRLELSPEYSSNYHCECV